MKSHYPASGICFGLFEFNPQNHQLRKQGLRIKLSPQAAKVLALLLEHPGHVRTREGLRQRLSPASMVGDFEHSLNKAIHALRGALGDSAVSPRYIETVPGKGYRFIPLAQQAGQIDTKSSQWQSIAVLPFAGDCPERDTSFLRSHIATGLTNSLSSGSGLLVLAYNVVRHYAGVDTNPVTVGQNLNVDGVLTGEIVRHNGQLIVRVELINVAAATQVWGARLIREFDQEIADADEVVAEISRELIPVLRSLANVPGSSRSRAERHITSTPAA
ncbi:MAG: winged helix-turn-helix domain-containing protein [Acidobacteriales bacterium]|nr:winged helix-turn-helix domain-containing protein [Terriglobales bacterium]